MPKKPKAKPSQSIQSQLNEAMRDPRYWRDKNPDAVRRVSELFEKLDDSGEMPKKTSPNAKRLTDYTPKEQAMLTAAVVTSATDMMQALEKILSQFTDDAQCEFIAGSATLMLCQSVFIGIGWSPETATKHLSAMMQKADARHRPKKH